ncbi:MAG: DNA repair protein RadA [Oceanospirillaceae bacterium]|uniref:DNA repair protein RadA n=1 Tax=unclassified Thalassolituus TaxID=2624967 RepID=UPI000C090625|nr:MULTISPECIES: DNA repair protein RadA [unclassified Thalassolituus]MAK91361.1 DNA repair protein RadA [Thalassolituus sp.]MAS24513.1 DNA repair protein RadA [Oceanospirillaceae bacterium]MAY00415.1 DNA repair protein RadA [Oceanospirillaceae bacterium]MBL34025.1 DNA repair protein RadA [Oceanospirillaceae bacterium]MBS52029.1 DNA repair protein RadA [Oceanospirillaceae bacterium]|tara:strand:+ start:5575 stop:6945 length:1371 start_codon:yes stop_codon:yes gene_type:complete
MAKKKTAYVCSDCGSEHAKWQGQCNDCGAWNTLQEFVVSSSKTPSRDASYAGYAGAAGDQGIQRLADVDLAEVPRVGSGMQEFDRVLGGGLVPGSAILIGGHPGAGKSTLLLQTMCTLAAQMPALYVTGEESLQQVAMRAKRLGLPTDQLNMLSETSVDRLIQTLQKHKPKVVVIDSIQVMHVDGIESAPGSVSQVRESAAALTRFAKQTGTILLLVGHVTKDGTLAGPKVLEHMIDCSIMLEGDGDSRFRTLRGIKNRFGAINELGVFAMIDTGLKEVKNPSSIFLSRSEEPAAGSVVMVIWEGTRPLLVEIQALVDDSHFGHPKRVAVGLDQNRMNLLLAALHRHGGIHLGDQDVYINVVGGVKVNETSADLALLLAALSSFRDQPLPKELIVFGEVGLSGEIRPVPSGQERIKEAAKHGFTRAIVPKANMPRQEIPGMKIIGVDKLQQALESI